MFSNNIRLRNNIVISIHLVDHYFVFAGAWSHNRFYKNVHCVLPIFYSFTENAIHLLEMQQYTNWVYQYIATCVSRYSDILLIYRMIQSSVNLLIFRIFSEIISNK